MPGRPGMLAVMVGVYCLVSWVAWSDFPRESTAPPLDELERDGLAVWRERNCQSCHQLYGFGGFLGPDLTNRVTDETGDDELAWILVTGSAKMPALDLSEEDQEAVLAFLRAMNRSGRSQPAPLADGRPVDEVRHLSLLCETHCADRAVELPAEVRRGTEVWNKMQCGSCHLPLVRGWLRAPDLSASAVDRSVSSVGKTLATGRDRMPAADVTPEELRDLCALLEWVAEHRSDLRAVNDRLLDRPSFSWAAVPWWEF